MSERVCSATAQDILDHAGIGGSDICPVCRFYAIDHRNEYNDDPAMMLTEDWARDEAAIDWGGS